MKKQAVKSTKKEVAERYAITTYEGLEKQVCSRITETHVIYYHGVFNLQTGEYEKDLDDTSPMMVEGVLYTLDGDGEVKVGNRYGL